MTRVVSVGGLITAPNFDAPDGGEWPRDGQIDLNVRLFALSDTGLLAIGSESQSCYISIDPLRLPARDRLADLVSETLRLQHQVGQSASAWAGVLVALREVGIDSDPERLLALPFEALPVGAMSGLFDR